jgi:hypothetical protein
LGKRAESEHKVQFFLADGGGFCFYNLSFRQQERPAGSSENQIRRSRQ